MKWLCKLFIIHLQGHTEIGCVKDCSIWPVEAILFQIKRNLYVVVRFNKASKENDSSNNYCLFIEK